MMITEWISVEDRLPEKTGDYLVTTKNGYVQVAKWGYGLYKANNWNGRFRNCVIAWMDCPKGYRNEPPVTPQPEKRTEERTETHACDCISRQAVLDMAEDMTDQFGNKHRVVTEGLISMLPPVTSKPKMGHWIVQPSNEEQGERPFIWWKCSECGQVIYSEAEQDRREYHAYCGRCGAKMVEPQESEDKE